MQSLTLYIDLYIVCKRKTTYSYILTIGPNIIEYF